MPLRALRAGFFTVVIFITPGKSELTDRALLDAALDQGIQFIQNGTDLLLAQASAVSEARNNLTLGHFGLDRCRLLSRSRFLGCYFLFGWSFLGWSFLSWGFLGWSFLGYCLFLGRSLLLAAAFLVAMLFSTFPNSDYETSM